MLKEDIYEYWFKNIELFFNNNNFIFKEHLEPDRKQYNNLIFHEFCIIDLIRSTNNITIVDLICLNDNEFYPNCYNYYTQEHLPRKKKMDKLLNRKFYSSYINKLRGYFDPFANNNKLDIIILSHNKYNKKITEYFQYLNNYLLVNNPKYKLVRYFNINYINLRNISINNTRNNNNFILIACFLRNTNDDINQKTIIGIIKNEKQYIIDDKLIMFNWINDNNDFINKDYINIDITNFTYKFNFTKGEKFLIYINKQTEEQTPVLSISNNVYLEPEITTTKPNKEYLQTLATNITNKNKSLLSNLIKFY